MQNETKSSVSWWQQKAEELKLQVHLGSKEAVDEFEKQKNAIAQWTAASRAQLKDNASEGAASLKTKIEALEVQAALAKAEGKDALKAQQQALSTKLNEVQNALKAAAEAGNEGVRDLAEKAEDKLDMWQMRFDMLKLQLHLGTKEAGQEWEEAKQKGIQKLEELRDKLDRAKEEGEESWQELKDDAKSSWREFKNIFRS